MSIDVVFRGPILFLKRDGAADQALIPDGERVLVDDFGIRGGHPDGDKTVTHFAGIAIFEGDKEDSQIFRADLRRKVVRLIADDGEIVCKSEEDVDKLVPIDAAANAGREPMTLIEPGAGDYWTRVAARIEFRGGALRSNQESNAKFVVDGLDELKSPTTIPLAAAWSTQKDVARIQFSDADGTNLQQLTIKKGQVVFIYNWDERTPTAAELRDVPPCKEGVDLKPDTDFKWLYELFNPPATTFTTWLGGPGNKLPAPLTRCVETTGDGREQPGVPSPGSSGCVSAVATIKIRR